MEHYFMHTMAHNHGEGEGLKRSKSSSFESSKISPSSGFDCNICLDMVKDPVVTLCGHLYCWPCMYKWLHLQSFPSKISEQQAPQCPVCKSEVSETTLVPLYGWDSPPKHSDEKNPSDPSSCIPERPKGPSCGAQTSLVASTSRATNNSLRPTQQLRSHDAQPPYRGELPNSPLYGGYTSSSLPQATSLAGSTTFHSVISMFGEMICARLFGNSQSFYTHPSSYSVAATRYARERRQMVYADRYLSRVSFFLCCCLVCCLLLF